MNANTEQRKFILLNSNFDKILKRETDSMSINRFGALLKPRNLSDCQSTSQQYIDAGARSLKLTMDGNFDFQNKTLENLNEPEKDNDAVTKIFMENYFAEQLKAFQFELINVIKEIVQTPSASVSKEIAKPEVPTPSTTNTNTNTNTNTPTLEENIKKKIKDFRGSIRF